MTHPNHNQGYLEQILADFWVTVTEMSPDTAQPIEEPLEQCRPVKTRDKVANGLKYGFVTLPRDIGRTILVPDGFFAEKLGTGIFAMVVMMFLGIPVYVCATASVPVAAALILKGLIPGAALVFLMTGPATNAASFVTIWKALGGATALTYLTAVVGCALAGGILLDYIVAGFDFQITARYGWMLPAPVRLISAVILLGVLAFAVVTKSDKTALA